MATCPNKNAAEYKALQAVYKTELKTNDVINSWQRVNNTDAIPTTVEANRYVKNQKTVYALKQKAFGESLLNNLRREKIIHQYQGTYFINNSNQQTREYDEVSLQKNYDKLQRYLEINNIPLDSISLIRTPKTFKVAVKNDIFTPQDILTKSRSWDTNRSRAVVTHLMRMFPQIKVKMLSVADAKAVYDTIPKWKKTSANFSEVNSFYVDGVAYLIRGRVTDETAIEEMLHPFIDAIKVDNAELFNGLLAEAKRNFPQMVQEITDAYNSDRRFTQVERDLEIVTQALTRHFKQEYETKPTQTFLNRINQALEWFMNVIKDLQNYITGAALPVTAINSSTNFSTLAKLLNTEGVRFNLESRADGKVRYALTPKKQKIVDATLKVSNGLQQEIIKKMFQVATSTKEEVDSLSVNINVAEQGDDIVILNEKDHTYYNLATGEIYESVTTAIKGKMPKSKQVENQINLDIGNDVDALLDALVSFESFESAIPNMKVLNAEQAEEVYKRLKDELSQIIPKSTVLISQVVVFDPATKIAGTADLVAIDENGNIKIIDLKTSKNSIYKKTVKDSFVGGIPGRSEVFQYETKEWDILPSTEDVIEDLEDNNVKKEDGNKYSKEQIKNRQEELAPTLYKKAGVTKLSTRGQHNLQVNMYKRMFENMGYKVLGNENGAATFHMLADISGKGKDQVFNGGITYDGLYQHKATEEQDKVDKLIPADNNTAAAKKLEQLTKDNENLAYVGKDEDIEQVENNIPEENYPEYNTIFGALEGFAAGLLNKQQALENIASKTFTTQNKELTRDEIARAVALIRMNLGAGSDARSQTYTAMLRYGLKEIRQFKDYVEDPNNVTKPEYITFVLNFNRFIATYESLYSIAESSELNATQRSLVLQMQIEVNKLVGTENTEGIINQAYTDFVKETVRLRSDKNFGAENSLFTEEDLEQLMKRVEDISTIELLTKDMATQKDTLMAVMDKIYKRQKQILLDKIAQREDLIRKSGNKLLKLSQGSDKNKIYDFMLEYDKDGKFTGFYTKSIGQKYYEKSQELYSELSDANGTPYEYHKIYNIEDATEKQLQENIDLANKKRAYSDFYKAEDTSVDIDANGNLPGGKYHRYTQEFIEVRRKNETYVYNEKTGYGEWMRKAGVSNAQWSEYQAKYYKFNPYTKALRKNGLPIGTILEDQVFPSPKSQYVEAREITSEGEDMRSEKYKALYDPTKTDALTMAQREFYELYVRFYEEELLKKLPQNTKDKMAGRVPVVKNELISKLKGEGPLFNKLYANTIRGIKNFTEQTATEKNVLLDEQGNFVNSLPIMYTGSTKIDGQLEEVESQIRALKDEYKKGKISRTNYNTKVAKLNANAASLRNQPSLGEISTDLASSLIKFSAMAEHYEVMGEIEDTLTAFVKVIENREYDPSPDTSTKFFGRAVDGVMKGVGYTKETKGASNVAKRARKYMSMIFYENELVTKGMANKIADNLVAASSLTYVAFNPLGNFNNYVMGRLNNNIEMLGGRYFSKKNFLRAGKEYNLQALQSGIFKRLGTATLDLADIATLGKAGLKVSNYDPDKANNKYEGFVEEFRMMDPSTDIRESGRDNDGKTVWERFKAWGYVLQDAAEYNVQTRVGISMLMDTIIENSKTGESLSFYDAHSFNQETHKLELKEGYDTIVTKDGNKIKYNDDFRYDIRNKIREVNKQIHGNYAKEDKMVLQSYTLGNLAAQFKKWVAPAIRSRFQREYFDENLGHMEGRYRSFWKFLAYTKQQIFLGNRDFRKYSDGFLEEYGFTGKGGNRDQFAVNKLKGFYRTMGEAGIILTVMAMNLLFDGLLSGDDDDSDAMIKLKHALKKQGSRTYQELVAFVPVSPAGWEQLFGMIESPIATTKVLGEMTEAFTQTIFTPAAMLYYSDKEFYSNSDYVYQNRPRRGQLKLAKEWKDVIPILYTIQKWDNLIKEQEYSIKY